MIIEMCHSLGHGLGKAEKGYCYCKLREFERKLRIIMSDNQLSALWTLTAISSIFEGLISTGK